MLAIIPARQNSKRLKFKNLSLLNGKPLLCHAITHCVESEIFSDICVSSDSINILKIAKNCGEGVLLHKRDDSLATDIATCFQVCVDVIKNYKKQGFTYEYFALILTTSPLRSPDDIRQAFETLKNSTADCVMSVCEFDYPIQHAIKIDDNVLKPYDVDLIDCQSPEKLYRHNGVVIIAKTKEFLESKDFYKMNVVPYIMPRERSIDINTEYDLTLAEYMIARK